MTTEQDLHQRRMAKTAEIMATIREAAAEHKNPAAFLQALQADIETIPGAFVSFASRDVLWLKERGYLDNRPELTVAEQQEALYEASMEVGDNFSLADQITTIVVDILGERAPLMEVDEADDDGLVP